MSKFCCFFKKLIKKLMPDYPFLNCHFRVEWGGTRIGFMEVTGLSIQYDIVEYREGQSTEYTVTKMPGLKHFQNIVLKRGIMKGDNEFYNWLNTINLNTVERRDLIISLLNENHEPVMTWKAKNAFPVKLEGPHLNAKGCDVAIESLEIAHEGLFIETP
jgi:phage tail-like protein